jgi:ribokinase
MYKNLAHNDIDVSGIEFCDIPSGLAAIFVDKEDGTHKIVVSQGANLKAKQDMVPDKKLGKDTILLIQGELPMSETEELINRAHNAGSSTILNLAPVANISEKALAQLNVIILNIHEAQGLGKQLGMDTDNLPQLAYTLHERYSLTCIITMGPDGTLCASKEGHYHISTLQIKPIDTVGAGDAFCGFFAAAIDQGYSLTEALKQASVAGALTCTKVGAQSALPYENDILSDIENIIVTEKPISQVA